MFIFILVYSFFHLIWTSGLLLVLPVVNGQYSESFSSESLSYDEILAAYGTPGLEKLEDLNFENYSYDELMTILESERAKYTPGKKTTDQDH